MSDLIKREDAIKAVEQRYQDILKIFKRKVKDGEKAIVLDMIGCIKTLPSADRPQGEWIDAEIPLESGGSMSIQVCNLCKTFYPLAYTGGGHRFCPNCGARMKGADDYERATEQMEHDALYEPTYNSEDGSM